MFIIQKYRRIAILVLLFVAIITILSGKIPRDRELNLLEGLVLDVAYPFQRAIIYVSANIQSIWMWYINLINAHQQNMVLKKRLKVLERKVSELIEADLENQRLRELLDFKTRLVLKTVPARVIGEEASGWFRIILIDKGKSSGIRKKMAVVAEDGIVGHVLESSAHVDFSKLQEVLVIMDHASKATFDSNLSQD